MTKKLIEQMLPAKPAKAPYVVKYRNPLTRQTWTGRGLKPRWVALHLEAGGSMDDLLVTAEREDAALLTSAEQLVVREQKAITAAKSYLAQPESEARTEQSEPYAWEWFFDNGKSQGFTKDKGEALQGGEYAVPVYRHPAPQPSPEPNYELLHLLENAAEDLLAIEKRQHSNPEMLATSIRANLNKAIDLCVIDVAKAGFSKALAQKSKAPELTDEEIEKIRVNLYNAGFKQSFELEFARAVLAAQGAKK